MATTSPSQTTSDARERILATAYELFSHRGIRGVGVDEIIDTAGQDEYSILNSKHFIGIHGYLIVYSVGTRQSFEMVSIIRDKILNHLGADHVPLMVVGNKTDIREKMRQVTPQEGADLCRRFQCGWTESSARENTNVAKAFEMMIAEVEKGQEPDTPAGGGKCVVM